MTPQAWIPSSSHYPTLVNTALEETVFCVDASPYVAYYLLGFMRRILRKEFLQPHDMLTDLHHDASQDEQRKERSY